MNEGKYFVCTVYCVFETTEVTVVYSFEVYD